MAEWVSFDPSTLYPSDIASLVSSINTTGEAIASALDLAANVVDVAALFVQGFQDAQAVVINTLQSLIASAVQQLTQTGIYMLVNASTSFKATPSFNQWMQALSTSIDDSYDENRPILVDPYAYVGSVTIVGVNSDYFRLMSLFRQLFELFGALVPTSAEILAWPTVGEAFEVIPGVGKAPDWNSKKLSAVVPGIDTLVTTLLGYSNSISAAASASSIYTNFAGQLRDKATLLRAIGATLQAALDTLAGALTMEGAYVLPVYGQGDGDWLQSQWLGATGGPCSVSGDTYCAGISFLAMGGTTAPADALFSLFGIVP